MIFRGKILTHNIVHIVIEDCIEYFDLRISQTAPMRNKWLVHFCLFGVTRIGEKATLVVKPKLMYLDCVPNLGHAGLHGNLDPSALKRVQCLARVK